MFKHIKKFFRDTFRNSRAITRLTTALVAVPVAAVTMLALQTIVIGPLFRNRTLVPKLFSKMACGLLGLRVVFNKNSAPLVKDQPAIKMYNHLSFLDPLVVGSVVDGAFVGKGELLKNKILGQLLKTFGFIGVRRRREFNSQSNGQIVRHLNRGESINFFPPATTVASPEVPMFHAAFLEPLYGGEAVNKKGQPIVLEKDVVTQAFAINVVHVGKHKRGAETTDKNKLFGHYGDPAPGKGFFSKIWECMKIDQTIELTAFPARQPEAYPDAKALANQAALDVASIVNPGQTTFRKARIPVSTPPQNP